MCDCVQLPLCVCWQELLNWRHTQHQMSVVVRRQENITHANGRFMNSWIFCLKFLIWTLLSVCGAGSWNCSENFCPARCLIEGPFVTTFDGKQYVVPGKCAYVASQVKKFPTISTFNINQLMVPFWDPHCSFKSSFQGSQLDDNC